MMASGKFSANDYVDVQSADRVWKTAKVTEVNESHGVHVTPIGLMSTYSEYVNVPTRIARFRTKTKGVSWTDTEVETKLEYVYQFMLDEKSRKMKDLWDGGEQGIEIADFIQEYRGQCFFALASILRDSVGPALLSSALSFLRDYTVLCCWWLSTLPSRLPAINSVIRAPELAYDNVEFAVASMWPELMHGFGIAMGVEPKLKRTFGEKDKEDLDRLLEQEGYESLEMKLWGDFCTNNGLDFVESAINSL